MTLIDPPKNSEFLKELFWEIHEAEYELSDTWPSKVVLESFSVMSKDLGRSFLYVSPKKRGQTKLLSEIKAAIEKGTLPCTFVPVWAGISYFVTPKDIIHWAIMNGKILPPKLQVALSFQQKKPPKQLAPYYKKTRTKIIAQIVLSKKPFLKNNLEKLLSEPFMSSLGTYSIEDNLIYERFTNQECTPIRRHAKSLRNDINTLFDSPGSSGRRSEEMTYNRPYIPKAIPEVKEINVEGIPCYHFPLFIKAISLITRINLYFLDPLRMDCYSLMNQIKENKIMKLYCDGSPPIIEDLINSLILNEIIQIQESFKYMEIPLF